MQCIHAHSVKKSGLNVPAKLNIILASKELKKINNKIKEDIAFLELSDQGLPPLRKSHSHISKEILIIDIEVAR